MTPRRGGAMGGATILLALFLGGPAPRAAAQAPAPPAAAAPAPSASPRPSKSVYGKLMKVDTAKNGVVMKSDAGETLAWRFEAGVIEEAARFKPGDPMIVIYRPIASNEKRVTALAFPGAAATPVYVNTTGWRVTVRSSPAVDGVCGQPNAGPVTDATIPAGGMAEVLDACWCCAVSGETCSPANRSGNGKALLVSCFK
jgi:hypothetical protein